MVGTKLHQKTLNSIQKRTEPIRNAIKKYNGYCTTLQETADPSWNIALPRALTVKIDGLKDDPELYEDVWVERGDVAPPRWLTDGNVRNGIRAQLRLLRCQEERNRLYIEADNLVQWYKLRRTSLARVSQHSDGKLLYIRHRV